MSLLFFYLGHGHSSSVDADGSGATTRPWSSASALNGLRETLSGSDNKRLECLGIYTR